jgi:hypothetical protein
MLDLDIHEKEYQMERALDAVYYEWWNRMVTAVGQMDEKDILKLSNPFVIKCLPAYRKAKRKVLFIGKETNGWGLFHETLQYYKDINEPYQRESIIRYLQWMYEDFRLKRKWDHSLFWRGCRELFKAIAPGDGDDAFLHTELIPFDYANNRPPAHLEEKLHSEFNVLPMTIEALQPDVVIFLTGYQYDDRLVKTFRNQRLVGDTIEFQQIDGFKTDHFAKVSHKLLPIHSYRTYHPGYSVLKRAKVFDPIKEKLSEILLS